LRERRSFSVCVCLVMALSAQTLGGEEEHFHFDFTDGMIGIWGIYLCLALVSPDVGVFKDPGRSQIWHRDG
jgi:hypothetical protein